MFTAERVIHTQLKKSTNKCRHNKVELPTFVNKMCVIFGLWFCFIFVVLKDNDWLKCDVSHSKYSCLTCTFEVLKYIVKKSSMRQDEMRCDCQWVLKNIYKFKLTI